ncbi:hypothetical protein [Parasitella parasitica]|uniref:F-box domain-containing protein n=1 Tax=Parasitella parasitica TaxID=35722 RepID=A0A0B7NDE9_9FUNG|nr:hypothetical protein [Parasitella parasitica]
MWKDLPQKVAIKIFRYVNTSANVGQCRLVCQNWQRPADRVMLEKQIILKDDKDVMRLYKILCGVPARGGLIKHLRLETQSQNYLLCELLYLAFTPAMERLEGELLGYGSDILYEINFKASGLPSSSFTGLVAIPKPQMFSIMYLNTLVKFKKSLRRMDIDLTNQGILEQKYIMDQLGGFEALTKLELKMNISDLTEVDKVLMHFNDLEELSIELRSDCYFVMSEGRARIWAANTVKTVKSLKTLRIEGLCPSDVLEYLIYKYPNVKSFEAIALQVDSPERLIKTILSAKWHEAILRNFDGADNLTGTNDNVGFRTLLGRAINHNATAKQANLYRVIFDDEKIHISWIQNKIQ